MLPMKLEELGFGLYELNQYAIASIERQALIKERDRNIRNMYNDISPTITSVDYATGLLQTISYNPEDAALNIISEREKFNKIIEKREAKANMFDKAMDELEPRERDVIAVTYFNRKNDLGLSDEYFRDTLETAQIKLCAYLKATKANTLELYKEQRKQALRESIQAG